MGLKFPKVNNACRELRICEICGDLFFKARVLRKHGKKAPYIRPYNSWTCSRRCSRVKENKGKAKRNSN